MDILQELMANKTITCNYCEKEQCVVVPYRVVDDLARLKTLVARFVAAAELHNQFPFDLPILRAYSVAKKEIEIAFGLIATN